MMTMVATVLGGVPLVLAQGAGAEARIELGWIIVGGLGMATLATLYVTPVAYLLLAGLVRPRAAELPDWRGNWPRPKGGRPNRTTA